MSGMKSASDSLLFEAFWQAYPRKVGKLAAKKAFEKAGPTPELLERILAALEWQVTQTQWTKDHGDYIPYPATYLNRGSWDDQPQEVRLSDREYFRIHGCRRPA